MDETKDETIKLPKDFGIKEGFEDSFNCPNCHSSAVILYEECSKQNVMTSLKEGEDERIVLKCLNCGRIDILKRFLKRKENIYGLGSSIIPRSIPYRYSRYRNRNMFPNKKHWGR